MSNGKTMAAMVMVAGGLCICAHGEAQTVSTRRISLDGEGWLLAADPGDLGRDDAWYSAPRPEAVATRVPWIIQDAFPAQHGLFWYWRTFVAPLNPHEGGRAVLRFRQVDYKAEVWLNGALLGEHEDGETAFSFDVADTLRPGGENLLAVRVLNPTHEPIDGIVLNETPHRNKAIPYGPGSDYNHGGIVDSVELELLPPIYLTDLWAQPDPTTGEIRVTIGVMNSGNVSDARVSLTVAPATDGVTLAAGEDRLALPTGASSAELSLRIEAPRLWAMNDPYLYRVTARIERPAAPGFDERSTRVGFRTFDFADGAFRLNGRRLLLRCSHTGNCCPGGQNLPHDPDLLRRDLLNVKVMGFNSIRFIAGVARREQLDLCDEIGLLVYEEPYAAWCLADSPKMAERFDRSMLGMIERDRNHPSVVIWGLLNETGEGAVFRHAVSLLPRLRELDDTRVVLLNSGRWDLNQGHSNSALAGLCMWRDANGPDPNVSLNPTERTMRALGVRWEPGRLALHPGPVGELSTLRFVAGDSGRYRAEGRFLSIAEHATTDVHILGAGQRLFDGAVNVDGAGPESAFDVQVDLAVGDTLDFAVGVGSGGYGGDSTGLELQLTAPDGEALGPAPTLAPEGPWLCGYLAPGEQPDAATFTAYKVSEVLGADRPQTLGSLSNPGSVEWEDLLDDEHHYPRVPHTSDTVRMLREVGGPRPLFISEYGIGSAVHLPRVVRLYDQYGMGHCEDAALYRGQLEAFRADFERWQLSDTFASEDDYFDQALAKMADQRALGLNALRANPNITAISLTGTVDQGWTGEGMFTTFRELKPGTADALFDGFAPLRLCLFAEPVSAYVGGKVRLEAVLANEDALPPGEYPLRFQVVGPTGERIYEREARVTVDGQGRAEFALPVLDEEIILDGPVGTYRFLANFTGGAAATGGRCAFTVSDQTIGIDADVALAGTDDELAAWLAERGAKVRPFSGEVNPGEVILTCGSAPLDEGLGDALRARVAEGATVVFLTPEALRRGDDSLGWLPIEDHGRLEAITGWLYLKDEWAKRHSIFEGLPAGGLMDYAFYREVIPDLLWVAPPDEAEPVAGAMKASQGYASGLMVAVVSLGEGRVIVNTLRIREGLSRDPAADRLLANLVRYAASK